MHAEIQKQISEYVKTLRCQDCGSSLSFEIVVFPQEIPKTRVVARARAEHCDRRYTVRAKRED